MPEKEQYRGTFRLSPVLTQTIISQPMTFDLARQIEQASNAYFEFDPETFGGVLSHPSGKGPEKPYFLPTSDKDWLPEVRAISYIGVTYDYWDFFYRALVNQTCNPIKIYAMDILYLYPNEDGTALIEIFFSPSSLKYIAKSRGETTSRFPAYIALSNYGRSADFFGFIKNQIFPMRAETKSGDFNHVEKEQLGLSDEIIEATWQSWFNLRRVYDYYFNQGIIKLCNNETFSPAVNNLFLSRVKNGTDFFCVNQLLEILVSEGRDELAELIHIRDTIYKNSSTIFGKEELNFFALSSLMLANNLRKMYDTARLFRSDIYDYQ